MHVRSSCQRVHRSCPSREASGRGQNRQRVRRGVEGLKMDEGRKRVIGVMAAILASLHMQTADDLFGGPQGSPRTDRLIAASIQWAQRIMQRIDDLFPSRDVFGK